MPACPPPTTITSKEFFIRFISSKVISYFISFSIQNIGYNNNF